MSYESNFQRAGLAAVVPFLGGGLALTQVGLMGIIGYAGKVAEEGGNAFEYFYPGMHDFAPIMAILYTVSALPILLMVLKPSAMTKWLTIVLSVLLFAMHGYHAVEHVAEADYPGIALLVITAMIPYIMVIYLLLTAKRDEASG